MGAFTSCSKRLIPCKTCGAEAKIVSVSPFGERNENYYVQCTDCKEHTEWCLSEFEARVKWNDGVTCK